MQFSDIRASARAKADEEATGFISNTEINRYLNQGLRLVYGKIAQRFENFFIVPGTTGNLGKFTTVNGTQGYALPTTLMKLVRVEQRNTNSTTDNDWRKMETINIGTDLFDTYYPIREGYLPQFGYFVAGASMYIKPVPTTAFDVRLWFIPFVTDMSADSDIPGVPSPYHELIADYAALQCLRKSGEGLYKEAMDMFNIELTNMLDTIEFRDQQNEQMTITDQRDNDRYGR